VPSFYIHLCLQALQGGIWPHTAAYFWGLHGNYYNGQLSFQIGGEFGENPFHSHMFAIFFSCFLHTHTYLSSIQKHITSLQMAQLDGYSSLLS